jgi:hypothetical protein
MATQHPKKIEQPMTIQQPTDEGRRRYPATAGYHPDVSSDALHPDPHYPCTCIATCHARCGGECGCAACSLDFSIFCDVAGLHSATDLSVSETEALHAYRGTP